MKKLSLLSILLMGFLFILNAQVVVKEDGSAGERNMKSEI